MLLAVVNTTAQPVSYWTFAGIDALITVASIPVGAVIGFFVARALYAWDYKRNHKKKEWQQSNGFFMSAGWKSGGKVIAGVDLSNHEIQKLLGFLKSSGIQESVKKQMAESDKKEEQIDVKKEE